MRYLHGMLLVSSLFTGAPAIAAAVGSTQASWDVSVNGAPQYTIPIRMTEGVNGLTPRLAISYAAGERSILGVGFVLAGLSAVSACRKTIEQDGVASAPVLSSGDRYCLDGARLRRVGSGTYGASNTEYRTEIDQLARITSLESNTLNVPGWFKVETRDGLVYEYGQTPDSKLRQSSSESSTPLFWAVSRISDRDGNSIRFEYDTNNSIKRFRPKFVYYTDTRDVPGSSKYRVKFNYQTVPRPDPIRANTTSAAGGAAHIETELLASIELQHLEGSFTTYRDYRFVYQAGAGTNSRLESITECGSDGTTCLPATTFDWNSATAGYASPATRSGISSGVPLDINGDGFEDYVWVQSGMWYFSLGGASGLGAPQPTGTPFHGGAARALDWNGDGRMDLLINWSDNKFRVLAGTATGFAPPVHAGPGGIPSNTANSDWLVVDINADGLDDLLRMRTNSTVELYVRVNSGGSLGAETLAMSSPFHMNMGSGFLASPQVYSMSSVRRPDFNGDGRTDLVLNLCEWDWEFGYCVWWGFYYLLADSTGNGYTIMSNIPDALGGAHPKYGDFNADGLTDIAYLGWSWGKWCFGFGQGGGGLVVSCDPNYSGYYGQPTMTADYDGDGYDDFLVASTSSPSTWHVLRSTGTGITPAGTAINTGIEGTLASVWLVGDFNGDGLTDLGAVNPGTSTWSTHAHAGIPGDRLLRATDGLGNQVTFGYLSMTDASVYVKGTSASYPARDYQTAAQLVRTMQVAPAGGTNYTLTYSYKDARIQTRGRGQLGMGSRTIVDSRNGMKTTETYNQVFPFIGAIAGATTEQSGGQTIQAVTHEYSQHLLNAESYNQRYLPYRFRTTTHVHEVGGSKNGNLITEIKDTRTVNTFGNTTLAVVETTDKDTGSPEYNQKYTTSVAATYNQDQTNWCLAVPTSRAETRTLPNSTSETRTTQWTVNECQIDKETVEPNAGVLLSLVTDLGYDDCGNVSSISSYPAGQEEELARTTTIDYDTRCQLPQKITNPLGHETGIEYDWKLGQPTKYTDPNEYGEDTPKKTQIDYDALGRESRILRKDGTATRIALTKCDSLNSWCGKDSSVRVKVTRTERDVSDGILRTDEEFLDGFGLERFSHAASLESGPSIVATQYDAFGRPSQRSQPYFFTDPVYWTVWQRDLLGRVTEENAPIDRITRFSYAGRFRTVTDPLNLEITQVFSALDQLRSIQEPLPGGITTQTYNHFGQLKTITDAAGNLTQWNHTLRGFVESTLDPDSGFTEFEVNAFGETTKIRDANTNSPNWTTEIVFDKLSRPDLRIEAEGNTDFVWGNAKGNNNIGRLHYVTSPGSYSEYFYFDSTGRLNQHNVNADGGSYAIYLTYHGQSGLLNEVTYPASTGATPLKIAHEYTNNLLTRVRDANGSTVFWEGVSTNAFGDYQLETFGNAVQTYTEYSPATGWMTARSGGLGGGSGLINVELDWKANGNLNYRRDLIQSPNVTEQFYYDGLHRFDYSTLNGVTNADITLDAVGNITWKMGVGTFTYDTTKKRRLLSAGSVSYGYDAVGNMTSRAGSSISYSSFNLPTVINAPGGHSSTLSYGAFRNRYKQVAVSPGSSETTIYVAGLFERVTRTGSPTEYRHLIRGGNGTAAIHTRRSNGTSDTYYIHKDHLGSPELITNAQGGEVLRLSFGAYGERRDPDDWIGPPPGGDLLTIAGISRRGFTGHEHLDNVGLIHMNGRVYDPLIGRFLGVDPIVVAGHSQGVHPYAYVWNNPLRYTDPSGFCPDVVGCRVPTIGGGRILSPWLSELYWAFGNFFGFPIHTPSASPASAAYVPPAMVLPSEGRATFSGSIFDSTLMAANVEAVGIEHGEIGSGHLTTIGLTASLPSDVTLPGGQQAAAPLAYVVWATIAATARWVVNKILRKKAQDAARKKAAEEAKKEAAEKAARGADQVSDAARKIEDWLGPGARTIKNDAGDLVAISRDGTRRVRFDVNRPYPHQNPHGHVEELVNGRWVKSGPIFPKDVTPK